MKILMIGDVVGKPGRTAVLDRLQDLKEQHAIDFTIMNAENVAGGFSITPALADHLFAHGIDVMNLLAHRQHDAEARLAAHHSGVAFGGAGQGIDLVHRADVGLHAEV